MFSLLFVLLEKENSTNNFVSALSVNAVLKVDLKLSYHKAISL